MRVFLLSSSRADYSIYLPLMEKLKGDPFFDLKVIAFGTHLSTLHGNTVSQFYKDGFTPYVELENLVLGDSPEAIATSIGLTTVKFSSIWAREKACADLIICLGDRYEMFAAVQAAIPFNLNIAHIHGGETTLGAIDNIFRHSLTLMAKYHFTSTIKSAGKVAEIRGSAENIYEVGALGLDNLNKIQLLSIEDFKQRFNIDLSRPTVLVTLHPETASIEANESLADETIAVLDALEEQVVITMPNADTLGNKIREKLSGLIQRKSSVIGVESLGTVGYFSCMKHCRYLLGNSSSGIIEAASLGKYVINIGDRQKGRESGSNIIHCPAKRNSIFQAINKLKNKKEYSDKNIYGDGKTADRIIKILKSLSPQ